MIDLAKIASDVTAAIYLVSDLVINYMEIPRKTIVLFWTVTWLPFNADKNQEYEQYE